MTNRESVVYYHPDAACVTRVTPRRTEYRIATNAAAGRQFLSAWCGGEELAWRAAARSVWNRVYDKIS